MGGMSESSIIRYWLLADNLTVRFPAGAFKDVCSDLKYDIQFIPGKKDY